MPETDLWQRKAKASLRDQLDNSLSANTTSVMHGKDSNYNDKINTWLAKTNQQIVSWNQTIQEIQTSEKTDFGNAISCCARINAPCN